MVYVEKMPANLVTSLKSTGTFAVRGLYEQVAYLGCADQVLALQNVAVTLTPISLALDCRIDFRTSLEAGLAGSLANGILTLGTFTVDLRRARPVDLALSPADRPDEMSGSLSGWRQMIRAVLMETLAEREFSQAERMRPEGRLVRGHAGMPPVLGIGDLLLGLQGLQPLPLPDRAQAGVDVRGAFIRHMNRFLGHAGAAERPGMDSGFAQALAQDLVGVVGLGPGLTPSGDDFLAGLLSVLWFLHGRPDGQDRAVEQTGRDDGFPAGALLQALCQAIHQKLSATTPISAAFLREAAAGRFNEQLRSHFAGMARGDREMARRHLSAVARAGHSSGTDTLGGMLLGLDLASAAVGTNRTSPRQAPSRQDAHDTSRIDFN